MKFSLKRSDAIAAAIFLVFALVFSLISFVNHYQFRTAALDLGMHNHALYDFAHFSVNHYSLSINGATINYFGDHFSPIMLFYIPFYYLFGTYALLVIQLASVLLGGLGIYRFAKLFHHDTFLPHLLLLQFFCIWGIYSALSFDFHNNVVAAMLLPWLAYYYDLKNRKLFLLIFLLILLSKENMALWLVFILAGLMLTNWKLTWRGNLRFEIPLIFFSALYFLVVTAYIMPSLGSAADTNPYRRYADLGNSPLEIILSLIKNPKYIFTLFFEQYTGNGQLSGIKSELHFMVLFSGGIALLYRPWYLVMLIPIYAQKLLTNNEALWGINFHYSIEFVPVISLALTEFLIGMKRRTAYAWAGGVIFLTVMANFITMESRTAPWYDRANTAFYRKEHYTSRLDLDQVRTNLKLIPDDVPISVGPNFAPHLCNRDKIYHFPIIRDAEYIVLFTAKRSTYPLKPEEYHKKISDLKASGEFRILAENADMLIMQKAGSQ